MRVPDHAEQRVGLFIAVDNPLCVEDFMATMLGIGLCEHHQLDIGRIARHALKILQQIIDFIAGERQSHFAIGTLQRSAPSGQ